VREQHIYSIMHGATIKGYKLHFLCSEV